MIVGLLIAEKTTYHEGRSSEMHASLAAELPPEEMAAGLIEPSVEAGISKDKIRHVGEEGSDCLIGPEGF